MPNDEPWDCLKCGARMHRELAAPANEISDRLRGAKPMEVGHLCGLCKQIHLVTEQGTLRKPTVAEMFAIQCEWDRTLQRIDQTVFPQSATPKGTLVLFPE